MKDYIELGPTPVDEDAAQIKVQDDFLIQNLLECKAYKAQLLRTSPGADVRIKSFRHEFGTYHEVCIYFDPADEAECERAFNLEGSTPLEWDDEARAELTAAGYRHLR
jgi:hypothetical protein